MYNMYFIILSVEASALLVSSVITIVMLLRKQFKRWINTPLHILSISDVLFSIFTSSILFINYTGKISHINSNKGNSNSFLNSPVWNEGFKTQQIKLERFTMVSNNITNDNNIIPECNAIDVIMKYGMLFLPLTNSFVSLLMFSIQCSLSVINLRNWCSKYLQFQREIYKNEIHANQSEPDDMEKYETPATKFVSISKLMKFEKFQILQQKFMQAFKFNDTKKDKKVTSILLVNQWIIPILIIGILYLSEYNNRNYINDMKHIQCFTESNFFFDDCYNNITEKVTTSTDPTTLYKDYISNEDLIKSSDLNNTDVDEIIFKVQSIVNAALNETFVSSHNVTSNDHLEFLNTTKYLKPNAETMIINDNDINTLITGYKHPYSLRNLTNNVSVQNSSILSNNATNNYNEELMPIKENNLNEMQYDTSVTSNDQTYAETLEHTNYILRNFYQNNSQYEGKLKQNVSEDLQYNSTSDNQNILSVIKVVIDQNDNVSKIIQTYVTNKCYASITFLKLHLLIFIFVIYFLPILFSSILHQHGKLNCQILLEKIKAKHEILLNNISFTNEMIYTDTNEATTSSERFKCMEAGFKESINSCISSKETQISHEDNKKDSKQYEHNEQYDVSFDEKKLYLNMTNQVRNALKLFGIIKMSLLCGILLWTPIFLELLLKVFMLSNIPEWLTNITYLSATAFGILRNIFNLKMIKLQDINTSISKTNIIHPIV